MNARSHRLKQTIHHNAGNLISVLENSPHVSYILDSRFRITYCNPAWDRFAYRNALHPLTAASVIGTPAWKFTPWELQPFFAMVFDHVRSTGNSWRHTYDCSSPRIHRLSEMTIYPLVDPIGYLITNSVLVEESHTHALDPDPSRYHDELSKLTICSHCRCTRAVSDPITWEFVPSHLGLPADQVEHNLCPLCRAYLYAPPLWIPGTPRVQRQSAPGAAF